MNDLKKIFQQYKDKFPNLGDVIIMSISVKQMGYPKEVISRSFNVLVSKEEYESGDKMEIIDSLFKYSKRLDK
jgi:hypothetical protein